MDRVFSFLLWPKHEVRGPWKQGRKRQGSITCRTDRANEANKIFIMWLCWLIWFGKGDRELEVRTATYGPGVDQSQHAKFVSHIIRFVILLIAIRLVWGPWPATWKLYVTTVYRIRVFLSEDTDDKPCPQSQFGLHVSSSYIPFTIRTKSDCINKNGTTCNIDSNNKTKNITTSKKSKAASCETGFLRN